MDTLTRHDVLALLDLPGTHWVSIYLPTGPVAGESAQGPIQLKNLLTAAEDQLVARGHRRAEARDLLAPAGDLVRDPLFWRERAAGLALFVGPEGLRYWRGSVAYQPLAVCGPRPAVRPLLTAAAAARPFYVLAVSQNAVRIFRGDAKGMVELPATELPENLAETLRSDQPEGLLQAHSAQPAYRGKEGVAFHGQGGEVDAHKDEVLAYFRAIDRGLRTLLRGESAPLVFAGVESLFPLYRRVNSYPHLVGECLGGNPDRVSPAELFARASELLLPTWQGEQHRDARRIVREVGTGTVSNDLAEVVVAGQEGRVAVLFVAADRHAWGRFDPTTRGIALASSDGPGEDDLLELATADVLRQGGRVYVVPAEEVPGGDLVAAVFRYAAPLPIAPREHEHVG